MKKDHIKVNSKNAEKILGQAIKKMEEISLNDLSKHCPLCGGICENLYCKDCDFHYKKDMIYFNN